jgi:hypothetical protein
MKLVSFLYMSVVAIHVWFSVFNIMHEFHDIYIFPMDVICLDNFYVSAPFAYIS